MAAGKIELEEMVLYCLVDAQYPDVEGRSSRRQGPVQTQSLQEEMVVEERRVVLDGAVKAHGQRLRRAIQKLTCREAKQLPTFRLASRC